MYAKFPPSIIGGYIDLSYGAMKALKASILVLLYILILTASIRAEVGYTLKDGETLSEVAAKFHVSLEELLNANDIKEQSSVESGCRLVIPYPDGKHDNSIFDLSADDPDIEVSISVDAKKIKGQNLLDLSTYDEKIVEITNRGKKPERDNLKTGKVEKPDPEKAKLEPAQKLKKIDFIMHDVVKGDTVEKLSKIYKVSQDSIFKTNKLSKRTTLRIGQKLKIPNPAVQERNSDLDDGIVHRQLAKRDQLARYALRFVGLRYKFGQSDLDSGTDCSGFTMEVYERFGENLPHSSIEQSRMGKPVNKDALIPGDLVFFRTNGKTISHVGIYIGEGNFVHNTRSNGVVMVDQLSDSYYVERYVCARRIL